MSKAFLGERPRIVKSFIAALAALFISGYAISPCVAADEEASDAQDAADSSVQLPEVSVTAQKNKAEKLEGQTSEGYRYTAASVGPLGTTDLKKTPYSIDVTSGELFRNRMAHTRSDALETNPAVASLMEADGYCSMTELMIRGFTASDQDDMRDGMTDRSWTVFPLENVDRIEVLNGMSGFMYGFSTPGGVVNYITKQPTKKPLYSLETGVYGGGVAYGHADLGGPVDGTEGNLTYRINAYKESGDTYKKDSDQRRFFFSGIMKYDFTPGTSLTFDAWHQDFNLDGTTPYFGVDTGSGVEVPSASLFDATKQYGQDWTFNRSEKSLYGVAFQSRLNKVFKFRSAFRYGSMWRQYKWISIALNNDGSYKETANYTPRQYETTKSGYALMDSDFDTLGLKNHATFGYTGTEFTFRRGDDVSQVLGNSSLSSLVSYADPDLTVGSINKIAHQAMHNVVLGDKIDLTDKVSVTGGLNYAMYDSWTKKSGAFTKLDQGALTPTLGLTYAPWKPVSFYGSYIEGLAAGGTAPSGTANAGSILKPDVSKQYEVGTKATVGKTDLTLALFRIDKVNNFTDASDNTYKSDGREVHKGLEFTTKGRVTDNLTLVGGFTVLRARVVKTSSASLENKIPVNVPEKQARIYAEYKLPFAQELTLTGGAFYNGKRPVDAENIGFFGDSVTFDAGARYQKKIDGNDLTVKLQIKNLFDKKYWSYYYDAGSFSGLYLGEPRTINLGVSYAW